MQKKCKDGERKSMLTSGHGLRVDDDDDEGRDETKLFRQGIDGFGLMSDSIRHSGDSAHFLPLFLFTRFLFLFFFFSAMKNISTINILQLSFLIFYKETVERASGHGWAIRILLAQYSNKNKMKHKRYEIIIIVHFCVYFSLNYLNFLVI